MPPASGSSPLTRGAHRHRHRQQEHARLIPAHAGSTWAFLGVHPCGSAHPRSRGEHKQAIRQLGQEDGSSPLTRGARACPETAFCRAGLIPAHAGSTVLVRCMTRVVGAHPRSRGEHDIMVTMPVPKGGSSPLTRGAQLVLAERWDDVRLIPAHAGSTASRLSCRPHTRAHPRSRGEHPCVSRGEPLLMGSSPLTRGARGVTHAAPLVGRLIPAHAGST